MNLESDSIWNRAATQKHMFADVHKYEVAFGCFLDIWIAVTFDQLFFLTYKMGINYEPIKNRVIFPKKYFVQKFT